MIVYRFDSIADVQAWINSATRQEYLNRGAPYFDGPATQQVISGGSQPVDPLVTMVVTHRVDPDDVDDFLAWQDRLHVAEATFEGFRGSELFLLVEGLQDEWTASYRFDNAAHLDTWLTSSTRQDLLAAGAAFDDFELHTIDNSFGNWVRVRRRARPTRTSAVQPEDRNRGVGRSVPHRHGAVADAVALEAAAVDGAAGRQLAVQPRHELLHHALLREPAAGAVGCTRPPAHPVCRSTPAAWPWSGSPSGSGGGLLRRDRPGVDPALTLGGQRPARGEGGRAGEGRQRPTARGSRWWPSGWGGRGLNRRTSVVPDGPVPLTIRSAPDVVLVVATGTPEPDGASANGPRTRSG